MCDTSKGLSLAARVHPKYQSVFDKLTETDRAAAALYFLPHGSKKDVLEVTRPRVVKWYCPFANQRTFPSGHRYSINVYTGCEHRCRYCYVTGYSDRRPDCKSRFRQDLCKDLEALEGFDVPPAPVHLSNSTDALQPLEQEHRHTLFTLEKLAEHRKRFTTVARRMAGASIGQAATTRARSAASAAAGSGTAPTARSRCACKNPGREGDSHQIRALWAVPVVSVVSLVGRVAEASTPVLIARRCLPPTPEHHRADHG